MYTNIYIYIMLWNITQKKHIIQEKWVVLRCSKLSTGFPGGRQPPANAGDTRSVPGSGRSSGEGNSNPLQYSHLRNPMERSLEGYSP